jgi:DNA-binding CsgD family transcriptional regulator
LLNRGPTATRNRPVDDLTDLGVSCPDHPGAPLRRFRADGPRGRAVYLFCLANGHGIHRISDEPVAADRFPRRPGADADPSSGAQASADRFGLSDAELEVLHHAANGLTTAETADELSKSSETVKTQRNRAILKLAARNTTHAACKAVAHGLVELDAE